MKDLQYYKDNCEEDYLHTPISVLRYIGEIEKEIETKPLNIASVSAFVCPDCKGSNMAESNKREMWCNDCEENYRENEC